MDIPEADKRALIEEIEAQYKVARRSRATTRSFGR